jgi:hypothetical protein
MAISLTLADGVLTMTVDKEGTRKLIRFVMAPDRKYGLLYKRVAARVIARQLAKKVEFPKEFKINVDRATDEQLNSIGGLVSGLWLIAQANGFKEQCDTLQDKITLIYKKAFNNTEHELLNTDVFDAPTKKFLKEGGLKAHADKVAAALVGDHSQ